MSEETFRIHDPGNVALFAVKGPDALRYLNGQITQDARKVSGTGNALPACLLDGKGRVQFRVWIMDDGEGDFLVAGNAARAEELEMRLGKYLIADDAEIVPLGEHRLWHFEGEAMRPDVISRRSERFGRPGTDWLFPAGREIAPPEGAVFASAEETEDLRIRRGVPLEETEFSEPVFPQEAGLEESDISFHKGCYIGQEVISRIRRAGKVNKRLACVSVPANGAEEGSTIGRITSVSPVIRDGKRAALAYVKAVKNEK